MKDNTFLNQITVVDNFFEANDLNKIRLKLQEPKWSFVGGGVDDIDQSITYKQNRGVLFPARLIHYAGAPDKIYDGLRISVAWKIKYE